MDVASLLSLLNGNEALVAAGAAAALLLAWALNWTKLPEVGILALYERRKELLSLLRHSARNQVLLSG